MSAAFKTPTVRLVGVDRPALELPEDSGEFEEFMHDDLSRRFTNQAYGDRLGAAITLRIIDLLEYGNYRYNWRLRNPRAFWKAEASFDIRSLRMNMTYSPRALIEPAYAVVDVGPLGGILAVTLRLNEHSSIFCVGPNHIEALVGLGKLMDPEER